MTLKVRDIGNQSSFLFNSRGFELVSDFDEADIIVLNGGSDIATKIYGQNLVRDYWTGMEEVAETFDYPTELSARDKMEILAYRRAKASGKAIFAICRGAQLVNCLEGGTLWQDVNGHHGSHTIYDLRTGQEFKSTSVHHQMMRVPEGGEIIAVANESTVKIDANEFKRVKTYGKDIKDGEDPEIVWFPKSRALCIQGHPEYAPKSLFTDYCFDLADSLWTDGVWPRETASTLVAV